MDSYRLGVGLAHGAPADVLADSLLSHRHHGDGCRGGQPIGLVVAAGVVADLVGRAVQEGDSAETGKAGACHTEVLVMGLLLPLNIQQTVSFPELSHALRTHGHLVVLTVLHQSVSNTPAARHTSWGTLQARLTGQTL